MIQSVFREAQRAHRIIIRPHGHPFSEHGRMMKVIRYRELFPTDATVIHHYLQAAARHRLSGNIHDARICLRFVRQQRLNSDPDKDNWPPKPWKSA